MTDVIQFDESSGFRIARSVRKTEQEPYPAKPLEFGNVVEQPPKALKLSSVTATWSVGELRTLVVGPSAATSTISVSNVSIDLQFQGTATSAECILGKTNGTWYLLTAPSDVIKVAAYTSSWSRNQQQDLVLSGTSATLSVRNLTYDLPLAGTATSSQCIIGKSADGWSLLQAYESNVKRGTFTAPWNSGQTAIVTLESGGTVFADNRHLDVSGTGSKNCTIARDGMDWELIAHFPPSPNIKRGTFVAPWEKGDSKQVTLLEGGTTSVENPFLTYCGEGTKRCTIALADNEVWEVIAAEIPLTKKTFIENVEWDDGIKVTKTDVYVIDCDLTSTTDTIIESTDCTPPA